MHEVEEGEIDAATGLAEISDLLDAAEDDHAHDEEEHDDHDEEEHDDHDEEEHDDHDEEEHDDHDEEEHDDHAGEEELHEMVREIIAEVDAGTMDAEEAIEEIEHLAEEGEEGHAGHGHGIHDPHFWFDPIRVQVVVSDIAARLAALDPDRADAYRANADAYNAQLDELHAWIEEQVGAIPAERRRLVTLARQSGLLRAAIRLRGRGRHPLHHDRSRAISGEPHRAERRDRRVRCPRRVRRDDGQRTLGRRPGDGNRRRARPALLGLPRHGGQRRGDVHRDAAHQRRARDRGPAVTGAIMWRGALAAPLESRR